MSDIIFLDDPQTEEEQPKAFQFLDDVSPIVGIDEDPSQLLDETPNLKLPERAQAEIDRANMLLRSDDAADIEAAAYLAEMFQMSYEDAYAANGAFAQLAGEEKTGVRWLEGVKEAWREGWASYNAGMLAYQLAQTSDPQQQEELLQQIQELQSQLPTEEQEYKSFFGRMAAGAARILPSWIKAEERGAQTGLLAGAGVAGTVALVGQAGPQVALPEELLTVPAGFIGGFVVGRAAGRAVHMTQYMYGQGYIKLLQEGADPRIALISMIPTSVAMGLVESAQLGTAARLLRGSGKGILNKALRKSIATLTKSDGALTTLARGALRTTGAYAQEVGEEVLQQSIEITNRVITHTLTAELEDQGYDAPTIGDVVDELISTLEESAIALAPMVVIPGAVGTTVDLARRPGAPTTAALTTETEPAPAPPAVEAAPEFEAIPENEAEIVNPVDPELAPEEKADALLELAQENNEIVAPILEQVDRDLGTKSKTSFKEKAKILEKAQRPSIRAEKPWHDVEHVRDAFRFKTVINDFEDIPEAIAHFENENIQVVKPDTKKLFTPKVWGWRFVGFDLKMPNGQIVEYYMPLKELEEAKDENHEIFEKWREKDIEAILKENGPEAQELLGDMHESYERYEGAWETALKRMGYEDESDARASFANVEASLPLTAVKFSIISSAENPPMRQTPSSRAAPAISGESPTIQTRPSSSETPTITEEPSTSSIVESAAEVNSQLQEDIETMQFATDDEFLDFAHAMYEEDVLPDDSTLRRMYSERPVPEERYQTYEEANREFVEMAANPEWLQKNASALLAVHKRQRPKGLSPLWWSAALVSKKGGILKEGHARRLASMIRNNPEFYRGLFAIVNNDQESLQELDEQSQAFQAAQQMAQNLMGRQEQARAEEAQAADIVSGAEVPARRRPMKTQVRRVTGQTQMNRLVTERQALQAAMKKSEQAARAARREGREIGAAQARARFQEQQERLRGNREQHDRVNKAIGDLENAVKKAPKMDPLYRDEILGLTEGLDLVWRRQKKTIARLSNTRRFLEQNEDAELPDDVMESLKILDKTPVGEMTPDEVELVHDGVLHAVHLDKLKKEIKVHQAKMEADDVRETVLSELKKPKKIKGEVTVGPRKVGKTRQTARSLRAFFGVQHDHYDLIAEKVAGPRSTFFDVMYRQVKDGIARQMQYRQDVFNRFHGDLYESGFTEKDIKRWIEKEVRTGRFKLERGQRIALYLHSLDEDNRDHILAGGIGFREHTHRNQIFNIDEDELNEIVSSLDDQELAFAKAAEKMFAEQGEELVPIFLEKNGYEPPMREKYYPVDVMPATRYDGRDVESQDFIESFKKNYVRVGVPKGFMMERQGVKNAVYLNNVAYDVNRSVMKAAAYIGLELPLSNASKLFYHPGFKPEFMKRYGEATWREMDKALRDIAGEHQMYTEFENIIQKARAGMAGYALGLNPWVWFMQPLSYGMYSAYVKPQYLMRGAIDETIHPKKTKYLHDEMSPEWVERRRGGYSRDVAEALQKNSIYKQSLGGKNRIRDLMMGGTKYFDAKTVSSGMRGAVLQALDEFESGKLSRAVQDALDITPAQAQKMTPDQKLQAAYKFADWATERTQPMFSPEHMSALQRGNTLEKMFTMFSSFTNQELNAIRRGIYHAKRGNYAMLTSTLVAVVGNIAGVTAIRALRDRVRDKEPKKVTEAFVDNVAGMFFLVRDIEQATMAKIRYGPFAASSNIEVPVQRTLNMVPRALYNLYQAMDDRNSRYKREKAAGQFIDDSMEMIMMYYGVPYMLKKGAERVLGE